MTILLKVISIVFQRVYIIDRLLLYFISINIFHESINTLSTSDATKILLPITTEQIYYR